MNVFFIGTVIPEQVFHKLSSVSPSTNNVQLNYIRFLHDKYQDKLHVLSCYFGIRKISNNIKKVEGMDFVVDDKINIHCIGFNDRRLLLNCSAIISMYKEIKKRKKDEIALFIINNHFYPQALPVFLAQRKKDLRITILNEAFDVRYLPSHKKIHLRDFIANTINKWLLKKNDGLITFCEGTVKRYAPKVPFVELIHTSSFPMLYQKSSKNENNMNKILYAGLIDSCYGIHEIVDSFKFLPENYELTICGGGDPELIKYIESVSASDCRIRFLGMLSREQVLQQEIDASILLLIRTSKTASENYLAKYSAPSKLTEYLASGTPILATDIDCIPHVLKEYMNFTVSNPEMIAKSIIQLTVEQRHDALEKAKLGARYVSKYCTLDNQKSNLLAFVDSVCEKTGKMHD